MFALVLLESRPHAGQRVNNHQLYFLLHTQVVEILTVLNLLEIDPFFTEVVELRIALKPQLADSVAGHARSHLFVHVEHRALWDFDLANPRRVAGHGPC